MTNKYLTGAYPGGYTLSAAYTGLVIDATASVGGTGVSASFTATIENYGTVSAYRSSGVYLGAGGTVTNGSATATTALIVGDGVGVFAIGASAMVNNFGTIQGTNGVHNGVYLQAGGAVTNGSATDTTALIVGAGTGVLGGARRPPR